MEVRRTTAEVVVVTLAVEEPVDILHLLLVEAVAEQTPVAEEVVDHTRAEEAEVVTLNNIKKKQNKQNKQGPKTSFLITKRSSSILRLRYAGLALITHNLSFPFSDWRTTTQKKKKKRSSQDEQHCFSIFIFFFPLPSCFGPSPQTDSLPFTQCPLRT